MVAVTLLLAVGGCAKGASIYAPTPGPSRVPAEFQAACGQPGAKVTVTSVPVTVRHADCDLTGVMITYGLAQVSVPTPGKTAATTVETLVATDQPTHIEVFVDATTLDVTVRG